MSSATSRTPESASEAPPSDLATLAAPSASSSSEISNLSHPSAVPPHRIQQFDGLRAVALFIVFLHHLSLAGSGWIGVDIFFVLSGFLITSILRRRRDEAHPMRHFYSRRVRRILPPHLICLAFVAFMSPIDWHRVWYLYALPLENLATLLYPAVIGPLDHLWSLAIEEQFYLLWPLAVLTLPRKALIAIASTIIVISPFARLLATPHFPTFWTCYVFTPFRLDTISMGALLALVCESPQNFARLKRIGLPLFSVSLAALALMNYSGQGVHHNTRLGNSLGYTVVALMSTGLLLWASVGRGVLYWFLMLRPVRYIGTVSYMAYLIHRPMILIAIAIMYHAHLSSTLVFGALAATLTLAFATLTWYTVERPLLA